MAVKVVKRHRSDLKKAVPRVLALTATHLYLLEDPSNKIKENIELKHLSGVSFTPFGDGIYCFHITANAKGDILVEHPENRMIEFLTRMAFVQKSSQAKPSKITCQERYCFFSAD